MKVYRLAHMKFANDVSGYGAMRFGGRWNPEGISCLYTSSYISLCLLEKLAHAQSLAHMHQLGLKMVDLPADLPLYTIELHKLGTDWKTNTAYTQYLGQQILASGAFAGFWVPSAIVPMEQNLILNPAHPTFNQLNWPAAIPFEVDARITQNLAL